MIFQYFSRKIYFSRTFHESPLKSSTFQACANPVYVVQKFVERCKNLTKGGQMDKAKSVMLPQLFQSLRRKNAGARTIIAYGYHVNQSYK